MSPLRDELRMRYWISNSCPAISKSPRTRSDTTGVGGRKSDNVTGLTEIQKLASNGNRTMPITIRNVGASIHSASRASRRAIGPSPAFRPLGGAVTGDVLVVRDIVIVLLSVVKFGVRGAGSAPRIRIA